MHELFREVTPGRCLFQVEVNREIFRSLEPGAILAAAVSSWPGSVLFSSLCGVSERMFFTGLLGFDLASCLLGLPWAGSLHYTDII